MEKLKNAVGNKMSNYPNINWTDFNFPPCLNVFHFGLAELEQPYKSLVRLIYITYLIIFTISISNIISAISQAGYGYEAIVIFYAFLNFFLFNAAQMYVFYRGYKGLCSEQGLLKLYKLFQVNYQYNLFNELLLCVLWLVFAIIGAGSFNGLTKVNYFISTGEGWLVFLCVFESTLYLIDFILGVYCVFKVHTFRDKGSDNL